MMRAVFLDRDGTINQDMGYSNKKDELVMIDGASEAIKSLKKSGFLIIIVTNQSGISLGLTSVEEFEDFNRELKKRMGEGVIDDIFFCPHSPTEGCLCRKPKPGLFMTASEKYKIDFSKSWVVGDKGADIEVARKLGMKSVLVLTGHGNEYRDKTCADFIVPSIKEAAEVIMKSQ